LAPDAKLVRGAFSSIDDLGQLDNFSFGLGGSSGGRDGWNDRGSGPVAVNVAAIAAYFDTPWTVGAAAS
jgi:hypothetical protein